MLQMLILSFLVSFIVSFIMMKFQMKMIEKWIDVFFEEEKKFIRNNLIQHKDQ